MTCTLPPLSDLRPGERTRALRSREQAANLHSPRQYWALFANPKRYDIDSALRTVPVDLWTTKGKPLARGDRVAIWRGAGRGGRRGIVALGEVLSDPAELDDRSNRLWIERASAEQRMLRVRVRYVVPANLPMWLGNESDDVLARLSISRSRGGTVFKVAPEEWELLLDRSGGWPDSDTEVEAARSKVGELAGKTRSTSQGFVNDPVVRARIEQYAVEQAERHFRQDRGWDVQNVSARNPYDLECDDGSLKFHVEVKGTVTDGREVLLTFNEVEHVRTCGRDILYVLVRIEVGRTTGVEEITITGGRSIIVEPWTIDDQHLKAIGFSFRLPEPDRLP